MNDYLSRNRNFATLTFTSLAILQFGLQFSTLFKGPRYITSVLTIDDTYYYLQTAWNTARYYYPTFDGLNPTNGVQLLWFWLLTFIAFFLPAKINLLYVSLSICFLLNVLCYWVIWKIGMILQNSKFAIMMAFLWFVQSCGSISFSRGMENSLHALVFWCILWKTISYFVCIQKQQRPPLRILTVLLVLNAWTRLDSAIFSVVIYIYCLKHSFSSGSLQLKKKADVRYCFTSIFLALTGFLLQLLIFRWMGGSYLPVSGMIKTAEKLSIPEAFQAFIKLGASESLPDGFGLLMLLVFVVLRRIRVFEGHPETWMALQKAWNALFLGSVAFMIAISSYKIPSWYRSPLYIFWICTTAIILEGIISRLAATGLRRLSGIATKLICSLAFILGLVMQMNRSEQNLYSTRYHLAVWMSNNLKPSDICAAWNAGQLGFFSNRSVINLDGLMNSADYYHKVLRGSESWVNYVLNNNVKYLVDYSHSEIIPKEFQLVKAIPVHNEQGQVIRMWKINHRSASDTVLPQER